LGQGICLRANSLVAEDSNSVFFPPKQRKSELKLSTNLDELKDRSREMQRHDHQSRESIRQTNIMGFQ